MYDDVQLFIAGTWRPARAGGTLPVVNPATQAVLGTTRHRPIRS
jgi:succinate-semialdehyde dehydrogenase/glutarate-semialdehyde dehydrogenase